MAVSRWTTLIFEQATRPASKAPVALYHLVLPRSIADRLSLVHLQAIPDEMVTLTVDVTPVWEQKLAAIHCHRTQVGVSPIMAAEEEQQRLFLGREYFRRVQARTDWDFFLELGIST